MSAARYVVGYSFLAILASAAACGGETTELGGAKARRDGGSDASAAGGVGANGGVGASSGSGGSGGASSGAAGALSDGAAGTHEDPDAAQVCQLGTVPPPTTEVEVRSRALIDEFCSQITEFSCLIPGNFASRAAVECSVEQRIGACRVDEVLSHHNLPSSCQLQWETMIECASAVDYSKTGCAGKSCTKAADFEFPPCQTVGFVSTHPGLPCEAELFALSQCTRGARSEGSVTGPRGTCKWQEPSAPYDCAVVCQLPERHFASLCSGPSGGPYECLCYLNGRVLEDDGRGGAWPFLVDDCRSAASRMVNGECFDRVDCCFEWTYTGDASADAAGTGQRRCSCTADPTQLGFPTCEAAARGLNGAVVPLCPRYEYNSGNPPPQP